MGGCRVVDGLVGRAERLFFDGRRDVELPITEDDATALKSGSRETRVKPA
jgi:hypothetical protein